MSIVARICTAIQEYQKTNQTLKDPTAIYLGADEYYQLRADEDARFTLTLSNAGIIEFYGIPVYRVVLRSYLRVC